MKKLLLSLSALLILGLPKLMAQVPNAGFETWTQNILVNTAYDPNAGGLGTNGWWDFNLFNSIFLGNTPVTVYKDSVMPYQGKYCAKIVSATMTKESYDTIKYYDPSFAYPQTNGLMFLATISLSGVTTGSPVTSSWKSFAFYYKYYPNGVDTCSCTVAMYHWNSVTKKRDLIGGGVWKTGAKTTSWTRDSVIIYYDSTTVAADTAFVLFSAASLYSSPQPNDSMMVDEADNVASVFNVSAQHDNVTLYPNPATKQITLAVSGQFQANRVEVYDITGKSVGTYPMLNNLLTINTEQYSSGIYFYKLYDNTGTQLNVGKFSVVK